MPLFNPEVEQKFLLQAAAEICMAARTAPKGKGKDLLVTALVDPQEKKALIERMNLIAERDGLAFFSRDAGNLERSPVVILFGSRKDPLRLPHCGYCGFPDCDAMLEAGGTCSFNTGDLGIALGSAAARAADLRLDNRIMYSVGKAAIELGMLGEEVEIAYGLPLSVSGKSPFFDR
ncbi:MAG: ferredoxin [Deltaproteobacteria bacterium]|nr:MAG: ferredoxin [Deltaproteobacteria bacterium]